MDATVTHPAITAYEQATAGIPDCFEFLDSDAIRDVERDAADNCPGSDPKDVVNRLITEHFKMLDLWYDAIDGLDSGLRCHVVASGLPDDQALYVKCQAVSLFYATTALQRAVCEYHYGTAGPGLSEGYGNAYALSNSVLSPF